ncbi:MAG: cytochrome-c peroxidase [Flavobacteriales bacterium]
MRAPAGFDSVPYPIDNAPTHLRIELGRRLFYDTRLSLDGSTSCGSCHRLSLAMTDGKKTSVGLSGVSGKRNAPTLANVAWFPYFMMEGGVPSLEMQALAPLHDTLEMSLNFDHALTQLNSDPVMKALAQSAYQRGEIDPFVITHALAAFQRSIISGDSGYDKMKQGNRNAMSELALEGMELFFSDRTNCSACHSGHLFTDFGFYNIGLDREYDDPGRIRVTFQDKDHGKFKTPTLRNIELTGPYMHDGRFESLEEVIEFYNRGGEGNANQDERIHPLQLTAREQLALQEFLKSLTDWNFVQNAELLPLNP